ncbi:MAG: hypothetical protein LBL74_02275 [Bacteroidales bacterium]|jgi:hypothetical protein|nr:hypothetical protein [Bacteroidales bacterium]
MKKFIALSLVLIASSLISLQAQTALPALGEFREEPPPTTDEAGEDDSFNSQTPIGTSTLLLLGLGGAFAVCKVGSDKRRQ